MGNSRSCVMKESGKEKVLCREGLMKDAEIEVHQKIVDSLCEGRIWKVRFTPDGSNVFCKIDKGLNSEFVLFYHSKNQLYCEEKWIKEWGFAVKGYHFLQICSPYYTNLYSAKFDFITNCDPINDLCIGNSVHTLSINNRLYRQLVYKLINKTKFSFTLSHFKVSCKDIARLIMAGRSLIKINLIWLQIKICDFPKSFSNHPFSQPPDSPDFKFSPSSASDKAHFSQYKNSNDKKTFLKSLNFDRCSPVGSKADKRYKQMVGTIVEAISNSHFLSKLENIKFELPFSNTLENILAKFDSNKATMKITRCQSTLAIDFTFSLSNDS